MKEIKCTIIQDLLPLYVDEVVSQDTKDMVDEHLGYCEKCKQEYKEMKRDIYIPEENKGSLFKNINKKWRKKKVIISIVSAIVTAILLLGAFSYVFHYEKVIPYSDQLVKIETQNDHELVSHYYGESYAGVNLTHPMSLEMDGEIKNVSFIFYTETIANSPIRKLINNEQTRNEQDFMFVLPDSEKIDAVYYAEFDVEKIADEEDSWDEILERAELIWEK